MKPQGGVYAANTRVPKIRDISDWITDEDIAGIRRALKNLDPTVLLWFRYAHTSEFNEEQRRRAANKLFGVVYANVCDSVTTTKITDSVKLFHLIGLVINGMGPGKEMISVKEVAGVLNVDRSQFRRHRRWGKLKKQIIELVAHWDGAVACALAQNVERQFAIK